MMKGMSAVTMPYCPEDCTLVVGESLPKAVSCHEELHAAVKLLEELHLILGNTLAAVKGPIPEKMAETKATISCLTLTIGQVNHLAGQCNVLAQSLREALGD